MTELIEIIILMLIFLGLIQGFGLVVMTSKIVVAIENKHRIDDRALLSSHQSFRILKKLCITE